MSGEPVLILHPRCSKCRAARELLRARGVRFAERPYLEQPLSLEELEGLAAQLGPPREWVRSGEPQYAEAGLGAGSSDAELMAAMARLPILIERPIFVAGGRAIVGRPPERVLEILPVSA
jgi:arsenate reductase